MLLRNILVKQSWLILFPESRVLFLEPLQNCLHYCLPEEFRFILYPVSAAVNSQRPHFSVIQHEREAVCPS